MTWGTIIDRLCMDVIILELMYKSKFWDVQISVILSEFDYYFDKYPSSSLGTHNGYFGQDSQRKAPNIT